MGISFPYNSEGISNSEDSGVISGDLLVNYGGLIAKYGGLIAASLGWDDSKTSISFPAQTDSESSVCSESLIQDWGP